MRNSGFAVDGIIKLLLAVAGFVFVGGLEDFFLAPRWLVITALVLLFLSAATVRPPPRRHVPAGG